MSDCDNLVLDLRMFLPSFFVKLNWLTEVNPEDVFLPEPTGIYSSNKLDPIWKPGTRIINKRTDKPVDEIVFGSKDDLMTEDGVYLIKSYELSLNANYISSKPFFSYNAIQVLRIMVDIFLQERLLYSNRNVEAIDRIDEFSKYIRKEYLDLLIKDLGIYKCVGDIDMYVTDFIPNPTWIMTDIIHRQFDTILVKSIDYRIKDWDDKVSAGIISDNVSKRVYQPILIGSRSVVLGAKETVEIENFNSTIDYTVKSDTGKATRIGSVIQTDTSKPGLHCVEVNGVKFKYFVRMPKVNNDI